MYKFIYNIVYQNHDDETEQFELRVSRKTFDSFINQSPEDFDSSEIYNEAVGFPLKYRDFDDMDCEIEYPDEHTVSFTVFAFMY